MHSIIYLVGLVVVVFLRLALINLLGDFATLGSVEASYRKRGGRYTGVRQAPQGEKWQDWELWK
jgi:hypothetical protein